MRDQHFRELFYRSCSFCSYRSTRKSVFSLPRIFLALSLGKKVAISQHFLFGPSMLLHTFASQWKAQRWKVLLNCNKIWGWGHSFPHKSISKHQGEHEHVYDLDSTPLFGLAVIEVAGCCCCPCYSVCPTCLHFPAGTPSPFAFSPHVIVSSVTEFHQQLTK